MGTPSLRAFLHTAVTVVTATAAAAPRVGAQVTPDPAGWTAGVLFSEVAARLGERFYDEQFRTDALPGLVELYRPAAVAAKSFDEERAVIHGFLSEVPASHLALYSDHTYRRLVGGLRNRRVPRFGFQVVQRGGRFWVRDVLAGGPAARQGLSVGDRVVRLDGEPPARSGRLDWRSDDAWLDDPPVHEVLCGGADDALRVAFQRTEGGAVEELQVRAATLSVFDAAEASVRVIERDGHRIGYLRLWLVHFRDCHTLLRDAIENEFADCEAMVFDLRGRGGSATAIGPIVRELRRARRRAGFRIVALIDGETRSAKEVLADEIKRRKLAVLVGEKTQGAVLPASFERLSYGARLMFPAFTIPQSAALEGDGVAPDIEAPAPGPYAAGHDPILESGLRAAIASG